MQSHGGRRGMGVLGRSMGRLACQGNQIADAITLAYAKKTESCSFALLYASSSVTMAMPIA